MKEYKNEWGRDKERKKRWIKKEQKIMNKMRGCGRRWKRETIKSQRISNRKGGEQ